MRLHIGMSTQQSNWFIYTVIRINVVNFQLNNNADLLPDVELMLQWHDTKYDTVTATRLLTDMSCEGVVAFFGPEGKCRTEAIIAQSRNLPMISYVRLAVANNLLLLFKFAL